MKKRLIAILILLPVLMSSCSSGTDKAQKTDGSKQASKTPKVSGKKTPEPKVTPEPEAKFSTTFTIDTVSERTAISPYIYGTNQNLSTTEGWTARRFGGNRTTGYNWENNASNAGNDWQHSSDGYLTQDIIPSTDAEVPGITITSFHDKSLKMGAQYSLVTLQAAGYVAKDKNGSVAENETAPSKRWVEVKAKKGSTFSLKPDLSDNYVYMDELVNMLDNKYGNADSATEIKGYAIDNEPALWVSTHPRIHPQKPTCEEIVTKGITLSEAVKAVDPKAEIFGPAAYGFNEFNTNQDAPDWNTVKGSYSWYLDYYLDEFKKASDKDGKRLLDVLDLHWYPEARGGNERITDSKNMDNIECDKARMQAPRTLWDPTYREDSWIGQWGSQHLPLIPKVKESIDKYNPGTKLSFTEYNYGGQNQISGGIAMADVLGIFGKYGVYLGTFWSLGDGAQYISSAVKIYRNYDGNKSIYGDTKVKAETSDIENSSVYASIEGNDDSTLHIIVMNKNYDDAMKATFNIAGGKYTSAKIWGFDSESSEITERNAVASISGDTFTITIPKLTVLHIVLQK